MTAAYVAAGGVVIASTWAYAVALLRRPATTTTPEGTTQ